MEDLLAGPLESGDVVLLDAWLRTENVYESCRRLTGRAHCPVYVVIDERNALGAEIAAFCGASGTLERPLSGEMLRNLVEGESSQARTLPEEAREEEGSEREAPENLLRGSGRGLFYIEKFMDTVDFSQVDQAGARLYMVKLLPGNKRKKKKADRSG